MCLQGFGPLQPSKNLTGTQSGPENRQNPGPKKQGPKIQKSAT